MPKSVKKNVVQIAAVASGRRMGTQNDDEEEILYRNPESAVVSIFKARLSPYMNEVRLLRFCAEQTYFD